jgi:hypothetical protein
MGRPADTRLSPELARKICQRTGSAAVLEGSIANLGSHYVLGLDARNCSTGDILDDEQAQAARKEDVLNALTNIATRFRSRVGESLATIQQHQIPLPEASTQSLEALQAHSLDYKVIYSNGGKAALPFFRRAVEIDPNFAMAFLWMGLAYTDMGESAFVKENTGRALQLRDRTSDREKLLISATYDTSVIWHEAAGDAHKMTFGQLLHEARAEAQAEYEELARGEDFRTLQRNRAAREKQQSSDTK